MSAWSTNDIPDQTGRTAIITGANSGIGFQAALALAGKGAKVVLACRTPTKGEEAKSTILEAHPSANLEVRPLDLADLTSVEAFADGWNSEKLDLLINNAGVMALPYRQTAQGFEMQFGTNHLGHFALTGRLFAALSSTPNSRIVNVASQAHRLGSIRFHDINWTKRYLRWPAYGQSKLANLLFTHEIARRVPRDGPLAAACHPGYASTHLQTKGAEMDQSAWKAWVMRTGNSLFAQDAAAGALPTLRAAVDPNAAPGDYFGPGGVGELAGAPVLVKSNQKSHDEAVAKQLWEVSMDLTDVRFLLP